ncbi:MAG: UbiX family flavin prenyltransferase [Alicyclobacillus macrosporangiidus]|uniref:UbiX family flavin prenyltransferase n=1 Tax=Alicyclobacillus macrosporangiidus TaxID=392015 RepID=UPI0026EEA283|nr:UbiX family flavin prenyltransferase [Alicyclobacillus macrosporangiidus]MCL6599289.1 UbiX family flavin prenyltransferase [Alicyclobacillus macrosporangiidus]
MRLIVGMTGATGAILGIRTLEVMRELGIETHLILSKWAEATIHLETDWSLADVKRLASRVYASTDQAAAVSSGSFPVDGMVVVPCSMKTLASIRIGFADNLITRAADVTLKERRRLVLVPRETPLSLVHLRNMVAATEAGAVVLPAASSGVFGLRGDGPWVIVREAKKEEAAAARAPCAPRVVHTPCARRLSHATPPEKHHCADYVAPCLGL